MSINIHTNVTSINAQRRLSSNQAQLQSSIEKLSSGFRINRAADDAAGLAISEDLKADLRSYLQAGRNANDAVSLVQTAESAMGDVHEMLHRLRELAMQSVSDGVNDTQRGYIGTECSELLDEVDRIATTTEYNGHNVLDGTLDLDFQIGIASGDIITIAVASAMDSTGLAIDTLDLTTKAGADTALGAIDAAIQTVSESRATLGAKENRLDVIANNLAVTHETLAAAHARIREVDVAQEAARMTKQQILIQTSSSMLAQANALPQIALSLIG